MTTQSVVLPKIEAPFEVGLIVKERVIETTGFQPVSTSSLVHEIRNPLTNINLAVELLTRMDPDDNQKIYLDIILRASNNIDELVKLLVKTHQVIPSHTETFSMHELLDEILSMTKDRILMKQIAITKHYAITDHVTLVDKAGMRIALTNIIINAIEAVSDMGEVSILTDSTDDKFTISIEDNGCGMSPEQLAHIFEPFYTGKVNGLGIGLSATLAIFKINKVLVKVTSEEGKGTCFAISIAKVY